MGSDAGLSMRRAGQRAPLALGCLYGTADGVHAMQKIVLTGASGGIGRALSARLAAPGVELVLIGRDERRLAASLDAATGKGAVARMLALDVRDRDAMAAALGAEDAERAVDLVIANAGVSAGLGPDRSPEAPEEARRLIEVNLIGTLNTIEPVLPGMIARRRGQIAVMSSLAALRPHPDLPSYSATKAAVRAYGISLRGWLGPMGIDVSVICPGFVTSPMSARHRGVQPFRVSAERAAEIIVSGLARRRPLITFPWQLALLTWLGNLLPTRLSDLAVQAFRAEIVPESAKR